MPVSMPGSLMLPACQHLHRRLFDGCHSPVQALSAWGATLYGFVSILAITPLAALLALRLPLQPELAVGLAVFCCMPTTLSSGVTLTQVRLMGGCMAVCRTSRGCPAHLRLSRHAACGWLQPHQACSMLCWTQYRSQ